MDLSPAVAAVGAAFLTGALSLLVQLAANRHAQKLAADDRVATLAVDRERRRFEARERRYEDRREAVIAFDLEVDRITALVSEYVPEDFEYEDFYESWLSESREMHSALSRITILATNEVSAAAKNLSIATSNGYFHKDPEWLRFNAVQVAFRTASRLMLSADNEDLEAQPVKAQAELPLQAPKPELEV
jgi:hypothetical protein